MQRSHFCASIALAALGLAAVHPVQAQTIRASQPIRVAAPQPYTWASAVMGGVEYATGIVWNPKHPELLYSKNDTGSIYRLDRRRRRWVSLMDSIPWNESNLFVPLSIAPDANAPDTIYVAGGGSPWDSLWDILKTTDGGRHWARTHLSNDVLFDPANPLVTFETDFSGVNIGTGAGTPGMTWSLLSEGREQITCGDVLSPSAGAPLISGVWDVGGFRHKSLERIPDRIIPLLPGNPQGQTVYQDIFQLDANPRHPNDLVAAGGWQWNNTGDASYSDDNGRTLHNFPVKPFPEAKFGRIALGTDPHNVVWAPMGTEQTPLYATKDNGKTWKVAQGAPLGTVASNGPWSFYKELAADRVRPGVFYLYDRRDGGFYRSEDGGVTWKHVATLPKQIGAHYDFHRVLTSPQAGGDIWLSISGSTAVGEHGLYHSTDGGDTWTKIAGVTWAQNCAFGRGRPGGRFPALYLFGQIGGAVPTNEKASDVQLYRSDDGGQTWTRINDDAHQFAGFNALTGDGQAWGRVYVSTGGRGIFYGRPRDP